MSQDDLLDGIPWACAYTEPEDRRAPEELAQLTTWYRVDVPGTAAAALLAAGEDLALLRDYDRYEWWFRCSFPGAAGAHVLHLGGLATIADAWLNGTHLLHSENMFLAHDIEVDDLRPDANELVLRFAPLHDALGGRRPRPRWRSARVHTQHLRWVRTTLLGRLPGSAHSPAPVGPWRGLTLTAAAPLRVDRLALSAGVDDEDTGTVHLSATVEGATAHSAVSVQVGDTRREASLHRDTDGAWALETDVTLEHVRRWWPHTHGDQPLYDVVVTVDGSDFHAGRVGFRTIEVDRREGAFTFVVNGVPVFARGTNWAPCDLIGFTTGNERLRGNVDRLRQGNHNMVRVPGNTVYENAAFYDLLDEAGILLWQDCMFAFLDYPDEPVFEDSVAQEVAQVFTALQGRPCLALVCGGADTEEQAAYHGVARDQWSSAIATRTIPQALERFLPGTPYLQATPGGSPLPTATDKGVCHYFGVPAYQRPLEDFRTASVRFAAECLPLSTPPEPLPPKLERIVRRGLELTPDPRQAVHRDSESVPWDMADTVVPYLEQLFAVDALAMRQQRPALLSQYLTATSVRLFEVGLMEWRRHASPCMGALTLYGRDPRWGPGLGLVDSLDRPKATWYAMRRVMAPVAVLVTDEGFSGLGVHLVNDGPDDLVGRVRIELYGSGETLLESDEVGISVPARGGVTLDTTAMFDGFRDLSWAYRFGPPAADVVAISFSDRHGTHARAVHLPGGVARPREPDLGLTGRIHRSEGAWFVTVSTDRFAQWVALDVPDYRPEDSWFHLLPGEERTLRLWEIGTANEPVGRATAFNSTSGVVLTR